ncbi:8-amino-7-oxononanoate synthase [Capnocytophaga sp. oral taxon 338]|uniref:aminotransferase class I/II-fold pyridoxal phosphate-dependent enzyme n=1 Tax=Capnocytophaga sp. oral taxon 338 TaxID=710239 RepID=UPI000202FB88|nr:8-amino-7-oxononanoate synthase [Capnocytophaga sp. oral taxon 338]EGD34380.1 8-amino-7-oxononanoate synthase [Capnocytophaga sp. oral taxon 338 str. F0234]
MYSSIPKTLEDALKSRKQINTFRSLSLKNYNTDFYSNDYLGLARNPMVKEYALNLLTSFSWKNGSTGSRLLSGNYDLIENAESVIANYHNAPKGLIFNSGYDANLGIFSSIPQKGDIVLYDQYIHASIRDGLQLSKAQHFKFKHNSLIDLEEKLKKFSNQDITLYIATEAVFSMDGDIPDLEAMVILAKKYNAYLIVDEAHSVGVFGEKGEGLCQKLGIEKHILLRLITFGKAMGAHGAIVLADQIVIDYLINFARSFIYTTAPSPGNIATILASYLLLPELEEKEKLQQNITFFMKKVREFNAINKEVQFICSQSAIQGLIIPGNERVGQLACTLQEKGLGIKPILSPTVPKGEERLRICLHSFNTKKEIEHLFSILSSIL